MTRSKCDARLAGARVQKRRVSLWEIFAIVLVTAAERSRGLNAWHECHEAAYAVARRRATRNAVRTSAQHAENVIDKAEIHSLLGIGNAELTGTPHTRRSGTAMALLSTRGAKPLPKKWTGFFCITVPIRVSSTVLQVTFLILFAAYTIVSS